MSTISTAELSTLASSTEPRATITTPPDASKADLDEVRRGPNRVTEAEPMPSRKTTTVVITSVTCITTLSTLISGVVTVAIPTMAKDVNLDDSLLLWPASVYALVCGCTLLLSGSVADAVGNRFTYLVGCLLQAIFTLAGGLSRTGTQLIVFRAIAGLALSLCLPSAVSIITNSIPTGQRRNVAFACMGGGQPVGFSLGLTLGGVFSDTIGWRWGFHIAAALNALVFGVALWGLPAEVGINYASSSIWGRIRNDIDWIGAFLASGSIAMLSYIFAALTTNASNIKSPTNLIILIVAILLIPTFVLWVARQTRLGRPALIPNSLWRSRIFSTICLCVLLTWGSFNALEQLLTFYFQYVQQVSALETSLRFLPAPVSGVAANLAMGLIVHKIPANWIAISVAAISCAASLIMALAQPHQSYWATSFISILLNPIGADSLFVVSNLLITSSFPAKTQALAGAVFNTVSQVGKSIGLASSAALASSITAKSTAEDKKGPEALLEGYHAAWWFCLALNATTLILSVWGLRKVGRVGEKRD
ncbi:hypothetical protein FH972_022881 [Carpinus fangiana]|uniref:Major facilitator superfamily (MFS) profile domain-containing protein n=1 Tax=Carpinus fangiana TaxID=176857 RepID=A0A5N6KTI6_9ROSI|nr:hypothetical protein FH972_022881 [Carpinus fangiana]